MGKVTVEIVFALPEKQLLLSLSLPEGSTVDDAIAASELERRFPGHDFSAGDVGIWGQAVPRDRILADGDRVEIYRPLRIEPREARRQLALIGRTMGNARKD